MQFKSFLRKCYHGCWYLTAALIIVTAISISIIRLSLPGINHYKDEIETRVGDYLGSEIILNELKASWEGWSPILELNGIQVKQTDKEDLLIEFDSAEVKIDVFKSIQSANLALNHLTIRGLDLTLIRMEDGHLAVVQTGAEPGEPRETGLTEWIMQQHFLQIEDLTLHWLDQQNRIPSLTTYKNSITLKNQANRTQVDGSSLLKSSVSESELNYAIDIQGDILKNTWTGQIYLNGNNLNFGFLTDFLQDKGFTLSNDNGGFSVWTEWENSHLQSGHGLIDYPLLTFTHHQGHEITLEDFHSGIHIQRDTEMDWSMAVDLNELRLNGIPWQESSWRGVFSYNQQSEFFLQSLQTDYLNLQESFDAFVSLAQESIPELQQLSIQSGEITDVRISQTANDTPGLIAQLRFNDLSLQYGNQGKIENFSGQLKTGRHSGQLYLNTENATLWVPRVSSTELKLNIKDSLLAWQLDDHVATVNLPSLKLDYAGHSINSHGKIEFDLDKETQFLDLYADVAGNNVVDFIHSFPDRLLPNTFNWLRKSVLDGELNQLQVQVRGDTKAFPYLNNDGRFQVYANVKDIDVKYLQDWPSVDDLTGEIHLNEELMTVYVDTGRLYDSAITDVHAEVKNIRKKIRDLEISGDIQSSSKDSMRFIDQSPLSEMKEFSYIHDLGLSGPINYQIQLSVPLDEDKSLKRKTDIQGKAILDKHDMNSKRFDVAMKNIRGTVNFARDSLTADKLEANYFDKEIHIDIKETKNSAGKTKRTLMLSGPMDRDFLKKRFNHDFPDQSQIINRYLDKFDGSSVWLAQLDLSDDTDTAGKKLDVVSDLQGMTVNLPMPLEKRAEDKLDIVLTTMFSDKTEKYIDLQIGSLFATRFDYREGMDQKLENLNMIFSGSIESLESKDGLNFTGRIARLNLSEWIELIRDNMPEENDTIDYSRLSVNVDVNNLDFFGHSFENVNLKLTRPNKDWLVRVEAESISGDITIPEHQLSVIANLQHLHIESPDKTSASKSTDLDPSEFPAIHAFVKRFEFDDMELGEVYLETSKAENGISIDLISFYKPGLTIDGYGSWLNNEGNSHSKFIIDVSADALEILQQAFNFQESGIIQGKTEMHINAFWDGPPMAFSFSSMAGTLEVDIDEGSFENINPKAGRLFGLLSISSLPKRLLLDFSDIFGKGFSFDNIEGIFDFEHGHAYTNNLYINSTVADINMSGRTGLVDQDYDQLVTVKPKANNTLPVAGALFGPIGIGVGAVIYFANEMFDSMPFSVDKILEHQYSITGSWDEPVIEKLEQRTETLPTTDNDFDLNL